MQSAKKGQRNEIKSETRVQDSFQAKNGQFLPTPQGHGHH